MQTRLSFPKNENACCLSQGLQIFLEDACEMTDKDSSLSTERRVDDFMRALANILRGITGENPDSLPPGLPTPVKLEPDQEKSDRHGLSS